MMPEGLEKLRSARILVVEDSLSNQILARDLLQHAGAHVDLAANGREAVVAVDDAHARYDAVLMDLQMPVMDGLEATAIIRERFSGQELPIVVTTANIAPSEQERCLEAGATDVLPKPYHIHELYTMMIRCLPESARGEVPAPQSFPATAARPPDAVALPQSIAGVNMDAGLARVGYDRALYSRLLVEFAASLRKAESVIGDAAAAGDLERLKFVAHAIHSTAGNIGAESLSAKAAEVEQATSQPGEDIPVLVRELRSLFKAAIAAVDAAGIGRGAPGPTGDSALDREEAKGLMESLLGLLRNNDLAALAQFRRLAEMLYGQERDALIEEVDAAVEALDFETARRILERAGKEILG